MTRVLLALVALVLPAVPVGAEHEVFTRMGDESLGESLTLKYGAANLKLTARFDPANHAEERGTRVDVEAGRFFERPASFRSTLTQYLGSAQR